MNKNNKNITALVSCFARAYHAHYEGVKIFDDFYAEKLLGDEEYNSISNHMSEGITFFNKEFTGDSDEALRWIVDNRLSPSVLARSAFCEDAFQCQYKIWETAGEMFCKVQSSGEQQRIKCQYLIYGAGYDTFSCRHSELAGKIKIYELDLPDMIEDKISKVEALKSAERRGIEAETNFTEVAYVPCDLSEAGWRNVLVKAGYDCQIPSFSSLLGISYYLEKAEFENLIGQMSEIICEGSSIVFDYPGYSRSENTLCNEKLAQEAGETMKAKYGEQEMEKLLDKYGLLVYEHLNNETIKGRFFDEYNIANPENVIKPPAGVNYILAVKKHDRCLCTAD